MLKAMSSLLLLTSLLLAALLVVECLGENNRDSDELVERDAATAKAALKVYQGLLLTFNVGRVLNGLTLKPHTERMVKIQQRVDGTIGFDRNWNEYVKGFGDIRTNFWIGLNSLKFLCINDCVKLRINMWFSGHAKNETSGVFQYFSNVYRYVEYSMFGLGPPETGYRLYLEGYHGTMEDALSDNIGAPFFTKDRHNGSHPHTNCISVDLSGGWWFEDTPGAHCPLSNLNGDYSSILWFERLFDHWIPAAAHATRIEMYAGIRQ